MFTLSEHSAWIVPFRSVEMVLSLQDDCQSSLESVLTGFFFSQLSLSSWTWPHWNQCDSLLSRSKTEVSPSMSWLTTVGCLDCLGFFKSAAFSSSTVFIFSHLVSFCHAAGTMLVPERRTEDGFEFHFALNYLGHFLLTNLLLDTLKRSGRQGCCSRIVNMSSATHYAGVMAMEDLNRR